MEKKLDGALVGEMIKGDWKETKKRNGPLSRKDIRRIQVLLWQQNYKEFNVGIADSKTARQIYILSKEKLLANDDNNKRLYSKNLYSTESNNHS